ncbi:MAG: GUN4 domain-containing protein, partial [Planktothrix sp.]|uniref:GUN4 domain-containing protein n=1 Tax=Planktothrix sp. TaxID=3088171 RepID=UPI0038D3F644
GSGKPTVDVYCLAASLYYAITGQLPTQALTRKLKNQVLIPPNKIVKISDKVNDAILKGLELEPEQRPQTMAEFLRLLDIQPQPVQIPQPHIELKSAKSVNYRQLEQLLKAGQWKEADQETAQKMFEVAGRKEEGVLRKKDIDNFPCEDLRTIDQLWVKYSNGRFGFSVQKRIYQSVGGTRNYDQKVWEAFGERVGWRVGRIGSGWWNYDVFGDRGRWFSYNELKFNQTAPLGHLPRVQQEHTIMGSGRGLWLGLDIECGGCPSSLASRLVVCN